MYFNLPEKDGHEICWICDARMISSVCINNKCKADYTFYWNEAKKSVFCNSARCLFNDYIIHVDFSVGRFFCQKINNLIRSIDTVENVKFKSEDIEKIRKKN